MFNFSPLNQFYDAVIFSSIVYNTRIYLTSMGVTMLLTTLALIMISKFSIRSYTVIPSNFQNIFETIYLLIFQIVREQAGVRGYHYFPHFFTIFVTILTYNLLGLLPFSLTVTSHLVITLTLALMYFFTWILMGIENFETEFFDAFVPTNIPNWLVPITIFIEILSFCIRPLSLGIRLFANMLAGHVLLHIIAGSFVHMYKMSILVLFPLFIAAIFIGVLEVGIAFLQAYIFCVLLAIYLTDSLYEVRH